MIFLNEALPLASQFSMKKSERKNHENCTHNPKRTNDVLRSNDDEKQPDNALPLFYANLLAFKEKEFMRTEHKIRSK